MMKDNNFDSDLVKSFDLCQSLLFPERSLNSKNNHRESAIDYVLNHIKNKIFSGELKAGDKLPTEEILVQELGIGRGSVREAIKILQSIGIVKIIRGDGMFITEGDFSRAIEPLLFSIILSNIDKSDIYRLRNIFEKTILHSVIFKHTEEDLLEIKKIIDKTEEILNKENSWEVFINLDFSFHLKIASLMRNNLVERFYRIILNLSAPFIKQTYFNNQDNKFIALEDHKKIYLSIVNQDLKSADDAIDLSLNNWLNRSKVNRE